MKKNIASQVIGVQMTDKLTGDAFTGTVTAYITKDGGSQTIGSVGSGVCTHEGNGFHTYLPSQSETNADHIAFTFIGTGAIAVTAQVYTAIDANITAAGVASLLAGEGDTGVSLAKAIEMLAAFTSGKMSISIASGVATITYKKRDGTTTSFTCLGSTTDGSRVTTGSLS